MGAGDAEGTDECPGERRSRGDDLAVGLDGHGHDGLGGAEFGGDLADAPEGEIQAPVRVVAGHGEIVLANGEWVGASREHDPAVWLEGDGPAFDEVADELRGDLPAGAKGEVQAAVGMVASERETAAVAGGPRGDDLAVGLKGQRGGAVAATEVGEDLAPRPEGEIPAP